MMMLPVKRLSSISIVEYGKKKERKKEKREKERNYGYRAKETEGTDTTLENRNAEIFWKDNFVYVFILFIFNLFI